MTSLDSSSLDKNQTLDKLWKGATNFDVKLIETCFAEGFVYWSNVGMDGSEFSEVSRGGVGVAKVRELLEWEKSEGMRVSIFDERRHETADGMIQQDIALVSRGDLEMSFSRCHVFEMVDGKIRRWWEYYDSSAANDWRTKAADIVVSGS